MFNLITLILHFMGLWANVGKYTENQTNNEICVYNKCVSMCVCVYVCFGCIYDSQSVFTCNMRVYDSLLCYHNITLNIL